jgi:hypothetical protein
MWGIAKLVKALVFDTKIKGSNPFTLKNFLVRFKKKAYVYLFK